MLIKYIFCFVCCYKESCIYFLCKEGVFLDDVRWYLGVFFMFFILLFILDFNWWYGCEDCEECKGLCFGYFMKFDDLWEYVFNGGKMLFEFLFEVLLKEFNRYYVIFETVD